MLFDSRRFLLGNKAYLITPRTLLKHNTLVQFWVHMKLLPHERIADLTVYLANEVGFVAVRLYQVQPKPHWEKHKLYLPTTVDSGYYEIVFLATCGQPFESDIAIDRISITETETTDATGENGKSNRLPYNGIMNIIIMNTLTKTIFDSCMPISNTE